MGEQLIEATWGPITITEIHEATLNSPEQYTFVVTATGASVRAPIMQAGESAQAAEVETAVATAEAVADPMGT